MVRVFWGALGARWVRVNGEPQGSLNRLQVHGSMMEEVRWRGERRTGRAATGRETLSGTDGRGRRCRVYRKVGSETAFPEGQKSEGR
jgi:hypothetical protein